MIKVSRKGVDVTISYFDELEKEHTASAFCKDVESAKELKKDINNAIEQGYGFAKCRAILEGDNL